MGDFQSVMRKIVLWKKIVREPQFVAVLDCGHQYPNEYGEPLDAEAKDDTADRIVCDECTRDKNELRLAEARVRELKARRSGRK